MGEHLPESNEDMNRLLAIQRLVYDKFPDDEKFILEQLEDEEDVNDFLFGQLMEEGDEDPETTMKEYGIFEGEQ